MSIMLICGVPFSSSTVMNLISEDLFISSVSIGVFKTEAPIVLLILGSFSSGSLNCFSRGELSKGELSNYRLSYSFTSIAIV